MCLSMCNNDINDTNNDNHKMLNVDIDIQING